MEKKVNLIGDSGEFLVGYTVTKNLKCAYRPLKFTDIGIDGEIELFKEDKSLGKFIKVQVKSSEKDGNKQVQCKDIFYWNALPLPVIIVYVDLIDKNEDVYYLDVSEIIIPPEANPETKITLKYENLLTLDCLEDLIKIANESVTKYENTFDLLKVQDRFTHKINVAKRGIRRGMSMVAGGDGIRASSELSKAKSIVQELQTASRLAFGEGRVIKALLEAIDDLKKLEEAIHDHTIDGIY
ncbi:DUF4365 domain-containing protein [Halobacteriovorax sp. RT-1-4]|uniref:DUF4365 domain-containing protein n=1 Tax=unclassified Halobacteriovorax TaxID=2639665 RepID=UPI00399B3D02